MRIVPRVALWTALLAASGAEATTHLMADNFIGKFRVNDVAPGKFVLTDPEGLTLYTSEKDPLDSRLARMPAPFRGYQCSLRWASEASTHFRSFCVMAATANGRTEASRFIAVQRTYSLVKPMARVMSGM